VSESKELDVFNSAAEKLPDGFRIEIILEKECGTVSLLDPEGNDHDFPSNRENMLDEIRDAVEHAVYMDAHPLEWERVEADE
jgi:hypothetical protein